MPSPAVLGKGLGGSGSGSYRMGDGGGVAQLRGSEAQVLKQQLDQALEKDLLPAMYPATATQGAGR